MRLKKTTTQARTASGPLSVRALAMGYFAHIRRRPGDVFELPNAGFFSPAWMEKVDPATPLKVTTPAERLRHVHEEIVGGRAPGRRMAAADEDDESTGRVEPTTGTTAALVAAGVCNRAPNLARGA